MSVNIIVWYFVKSFKYVQYVKSNLSSMAQDLQNAAERRQVKQCFFIIKDVPGAGKFMSWQILCDLLELRQLGDCTDNQWTCLGPGARNGLRRIFREVKEKDELFLTRVLRDLCQAQGTTSAYQVLDLDPPTFLGKEVSLKNIEHALCEYDKYVRFAMGQGVRQRRFNETTSSAHYDKLTQKCPECFKIPENIKYYSNFYALPRTPFLYAQSRGLAFRDPVLKGNTCTVCKGNPREQENG